MPATGLINTCTFITVYTAISNFVTFIIKCTCTALFGISIISNYTFTPPTHPNFFMLNMHIWTFSSMQQVNVNCKRVAIFPRSTITVISPYGIIKFWNCDLQDLWQITCNILCLILTHWVPNCRGECPDSVLLQENCLKPTVNDLKQKCDNICITNTNQTWVTIFRFHADALTRISN